MTRFGRRAFLASAAGAALAPRAFAAPNPNLGLPEALELALPEMERVGRDLWVGQLAEGVWATSFTGLLDSGIWYPANGLIVAAGDGATVVDLGWTRQQGAGLLAYARDRLKRPVRAGIVTHFHSDRAGGLEALRRAGIRAYAHPLTVELARRYGAPVPDPLPALRGGRASLGGLELYHPGPGHSPDNIIAWHRGSRTLFGGCLLKSLTSTSIGNVEDADLARYAATLARLSSNYGRPQWIVPGHGAIAREGIIQHTYALVRKAREAG